MVRYLFNILDKNKWIYNIRFLIFKQKKAAQWATHTMRNEILMSSFGSN